MNLAADDLLVRVDQWKFKLRDKLAGMTPSERAAFWNQTLAQAAALGASVARRPERAPKRTHRRTA